VGLTACSIPSPIPTATRLGHSTFVKTKIMTPTSIRGCQALGAALALGATAAFAQMPTTPTTPPTTSSPSQAPNSSMDQTAPSTNYGTNNRKSDLDYSDRHFLQKAAKMGMEEVSVSRVVAQSSVEGPVKDFANEMVSDHEKVNSELMQLASQKGVTLSSDMPNVKKWTDKKPSKLVSDYIDEMQSDHKSMISLFEKAAKSDDADISAFAKRHLDDLKQHYTKAEELMNQLPKS
jgi:putative membrane protein